MQDTGSAGNTWDLVWVLHLCTGELRFSNTQADAGIPDRQWKTGADP